MDTRRLPRTEKYPDKKVLKRRARAFWAHLLGVETPKEKKERAKNEERENEGDSDRKEIGTETVPHQSGCLRWRSAVVLCWHSYSSPCLFFYRVAVLWKRSELQRRAGHSPRGFASLPSKQTYDRGGAAAHDHYQRDNNRFLLCIERQHKRRSVPASLPMSRHPKKPQDLLSGEEEEEGPPSSSSFFGQRLTLVPRHEKGEERQESPWTVFT